MASSCEKMSEKYNLVDILNSNESANAKLVLIKETLCDIDNHKWWSEVHNDRNNENGNKLRTYRQYKYVLSCSSYVKTVFLEEHCQILEVDHLNLLLRQEGMPSQRYLWKIDYVYFVMVLTLKLKHIFTTL